MATQHLHPPDADGVLLLYLAGELPEADRQAFEVQLSQESALQARLEVLRGVMADMESAFALADGHSPTQTSVSRAADRASALLVSWQRDRQPVLAVSSSSVPRARTWVGWRIPSSAVAAIVLIGIGVGAMRYYRSWQGTGETASRTLVDPSAGFQARGADWEFNLDAARRPVRDDVAFTQSDKDGEVSSPVTSTPAVVADESRELPSAIASADQPFFDVPLVPDLESGPER